MPRGTAAIFALLMVSPIFAQTTTGRISGIVTDASGAAIINAKVTITGETTAFTRAASTDDHGYYVMTNLPAGVYGVQVEAAGFKSSLNTGNDLVNDGRLTLDFKLEAGDLSAMVEVKASTGEAVNSTSGEVARVVDGEQVRNLALNTRNYVELFSLIPGAVLTSDDTLQMAQGSSFGADLDQRQPHQYLQSDGGRRLQPGTDEQLNPYQQHRYRLYPGGQDRDLQLFRRIRPALRRSGQRRDARWYESVSWERLRISA
jgi:carboxypeptidase family protein